MAMNAPVLNFATLHRLRYDISTDGAGGGTYTITNATLLADLKSVGPLYQFLNKSVASDAEADAYTERSPEFDINVHLHTIDVMAVRPVRDADGKLGFEITSLVADADGHVTFWFVHSMIR